MANPFPKSKRVEIGGVSRNAIYTDRQEDGALRNGSLVEKIDSDPDDRHRDGALASVIGSVRIDPQRRSIIYSVEWEDMPGIPMHVTGEQIRTAKGSREETLRWTP